jgi:hypothetical protein
MKTLNEQVSRIKGIMGLNESLPLVGWSDVPNKSRNRPTHGYPMRGDEMDVDLKQYTAQKGMTDEDMKINQVRSKLISIFDSYENKIHNLKINSHFSKWQLQSPTIIQKKEEIDSKISELEQKKDDVRELMRDREAMLSLYDNNFKSDTEYTPTDEPSYDVEYNSDQRKEFDADLNKQLDADLAARAEAYYEEQRRKRAEEEAQRPLTPEEQRVKDFRAELQRKRESMYHPKYRPN